MYYDGREWDGGTILSHCCLWGPLLAKTESSLVVALAHMTDKLFCYQLKGRRTCSTPKLCWSLCGFLLRLLVCLPFAVSEDAFLSEMLQKMAVPSALLTRITELLYFFLRLFCFPFAQCLHLFCCVFCWFFLQLLLRQCLDSIVQAGLKNSAY